MDKLTPQVLKTQSEAILERTSAQLRELLREAASQLSPFPPLPGAFFTHGIEVEPGAAASSERGCIIVGSDGELYEFLWWYDFVDSPDPALARQEVTRRVELSPLEYIIHASSGLTQILEVLSKREIVR